MARSSTVTARKTSEAIEDSRELIIAARSDTDKVTEKLDALHGPIWNPENQLPHWQELVRPSWEVDMETWARSLEYHVVVLNKSDKGYRVEVIKLRSIAGKCRNKAKRVRKIIRRIRTTCRKHHGDELLVILGLLELSRQSWYDVLNQAEHLVDLLGSDLEVPAPLEGMTDLNLKGLSEGLNGSYQELKKEYEAYKEQQKVVDVAMVARDDAFKALRKLNVNVARNLEAMYRMADMNELADRLRRRRRKARMSEEEKLKAAEKKKQKAAAKQAASSTPAGPVTEETSPERERAVAMLDALLAKTEEEVEAAATAANAGESG